MAWNVEQVLALAPDAASAKSGKDLSAPRKWKTLGMSATCAWGTLQGSGKEPYQACIDLAGPAFKCTCPSRKFPCKHGLGLGLILAQQPAALTEKEPPAWATEWLAKRAEKEEKKVEKASAPTAPADPDAAAKAAVAAEKRSAAREAKVAAGLDELGVWLADLVRTGFASLPGKPASFWETPAARLVDAQAPGLARRVRALDGVTVTGDGWPARLLREASLLHLAREGWSRARWS
ncbi:MAG: SWIM zinc finger family protein, partial [Limisphaerales bacterium]